MTTNTSDNFNVETIRADFPILTRKVYGKPVAYLDNAASSQKPRQVLEAMDTFYRHHYANVHRGIHTLSEEATAAYEAARERVATFIHAPDPRGVIFTRNATEAINLVAYSWGRAHIASGDRIVVTAMEHHSNLVPWQMLARSVGAELAHIPVTPEGRLALDEMERLLEGRVKLVACTHISNVVGTVNPIREIVARVRAQAPAARVLVDVAQSIPHLPIDVQELGADFYAFSGHKMCGPTGVGVLYGRPELLETMPPFLTGGEMIRRVNLMEATWAEIPAKFEAGTPAIVQAIGLGAAVDYLHTVGMEAIWAHGRQLITYAMDRLSEIPGLRVIGPPAEERGALVSFVMEGIHPHDLSNILNDEGVAIRAGYHCAEPLHTALGVGPTARASFYLYNTREEVNRLVFGIRKAQSILLDFL